MNIVVNIIEALLVCMIFGLTATGVVLVVYWYPKQKRRQGIKKNKPLEYSLMTILSLVIILLGIYVLTFVFKSF